MADSYLGYQNPSSTDKKLDSESLVVGVNTVERERIQITGTGATDIAGVDSTNGLDVDVTRVGGNVTVVQGTGTNLHTVIDSGTLTTVSTVTAVTTITNAVHVDDNASSLSVDWNGTQPVTGSGTATGALRVELPTNGTGVIATVGAVTAITNALPAGTNNIGDVDVLTVPAPLSTTGGGTEATALRVTIASNSTGVLAVTDNSSSLSVDWNGTQPVTGSGTATGALRVELPTNGTGVIATLGTITNVVHVDDNSGALSVDDNGGSLTVDGAVTATVAALTDGTAKTQIVDSAGTYSTLVDPTRSVSVAPNSIMVELLRQIYLEMRATRLALVSLVTEGGAAVAQDFDPALIDQFDRIDPGINFIQ